MNLVNLELRESIDHVGVLAKIGTLAVRIATANVKAKANVAKAIDDSIQGLGRPHRIIRRFG